MKSTDLFLLGRRLVQLAEEGLPGRDVNRGVRIVLLDIAAHPGSSISDITTRTGTPQSHVSTSVTKLRALGIVQTETDPGDRRRTLVSAVPKALERAHNRITTSADSALRGALGDAPADQVAEVFNALEMLAERLVPLSQSPAVKEAP